MLPELPELPEITAHSVNAIRLRGTLAAALPGMPYLGTDQLTGYNAKQVERQKVSRSYADCIRDYSSSKCNCSSTCFVYRSYGSVSS